MLKIFKTPQVKNRATCFRKKKQVGYEKKKDKKRIENITKERHYRSKCVASRRLSFREKKSSYPWKKVR